MKNITKSFKVVDLQILYVFLPNSVSASRPHLSCMAVILPPDCLVTSTLRRYCSLTNGQVIALQNIDSGGLEPDLGHRCRHSLHSCCLLANFLTLPVLAKSGPISESHTRPTFIFHKMLHKTTYSRWQHCCEYSATIPAWMAEDFLLGHPLRICLHPMAELLHLSVGAYLLTITQWTSKVYLGM